MKLISAFVLGLSALVFVATGNFVANVQAKGEMEMSVLDPDTGVITRLDAEACRSLMENGVIMDMMTLMDKVKMLEKGRMLDASLLQQGDSYVYEIEVAASNGVVHMLWIDALTGELLEEK
ncbi:MAG: PepSY domain-containing protein [Pontibacterium sp.]